MRTCTIYLQDSKGNRHDYSISLDLLPSLTMQCHLFPTPVYLVHNNAMTYGEPLC